MTSDPPPRRLRLVHSRRLRGAPQSVCDTALWSLLHGAGSLADNKWRLVQMSDAQLRELAAALRRKGKVELAQFIERLL